MNQHKETSRGAAVFAGSMQDITLGDALAQGVRYLSGCGIEDAQTDAWLLLEYVTGITRAVFLAERRQKLGEEDKARYESLLKKRASHIPLQHLTGEQEFMGLSFHVNPHVLIPRQDTETLAEEALSRLKPGMKVLDLCTGSGCIAVSLAKLGPQAGKPSDSIFGSQAGKMEGSTFGLQAEKTAGSTFEPQAEKTAGSTFEPQAEKTEGSIFELQAEKTAGGIFAPEGSARPESESASGGCLCRIDGADISEEALAVARENGAYHHAAVRWICSDLFAKLPEVYDMIVSNPPYIRTAVIEELSEEVRLHEPYQALDGREDGLYFYRRIIEESRSHLRPGGHLLFEIGYDQGKDVQRLMERAGFTEVRVLCDLAGKDRVAAGIWPGEIESAGKPIFGRGK